MCEGKRDSGDVIVTLDNGSIVQHGPYNDRIYLMKAGEESFSELPSALIAMAKEKNYSKVFAKITGRNTAPFLDSGFVPEAAAPNLNNAGSCIYFMSYYLSEARREEKNPGEYEKIRELAVSKSNTGVTPLDDSRFVLRRCSENDASQMADLYAEVFPTYPFPIFNPDFLIDTMKNNVEYLCIESLEEPGRIVALSSAEIDYSSSCAEMSDCATLPGRRGNGFGVHLLTALDSETRKKGIKTNYTIARSANHGINIMFAKCGYVFGGRLKNNTNIAGRIESMNIWYKNVLC
ncbi:MAG TPA: putative beta-lysine N-acetyltransferase [bacterium]|nr:putative beta-lysine N-acetyltransferase [bacterium]